MNSTSDSTGNNSLCDKAGQRNRVTWVTSDKHDSCCMGTQRLFTVPRAPSATHLYLLFSPASLTPMLWVLVNIVVLEWNTQLSMLNTLLCWHHEGKRQIVLLKHKPKSQTFCTVLPQGLINATKLSCLWMLKKAGGKRHLVTGMFIKKNECVR